MTKRRADGTFLERGGRGGQTKMQIQARHKLKTMSPSPGPSNWRRSNVERNRL